MAIIHTMTYLINTCRCWHRDEEGVSAIEFTLIFPVMFIMLLGIWEIGHAMWAGQKAISSSQIVADLIARELRVDTAEVDQAMLAGELAMEPFPVEDNLNIEILSVAFDDQQSPSEVWQRATDNQDVGNDLINLTEPLAVANEGLIVVRVRYDYEPFFGNTVIDAFQVEELAFIRGRKIGVIQAEWVN